jgi:hypothetical protein
MEKRDNRDAAQNAAPHDQWQDANSEGAWQLDEANASETAIWLTQADEGDPDYREPLYATGGDEDEFIEGDQEENTNEDDDEPGDWGNVDPQSHPGGLPDPMDPSGPGSAV